MEKSKLISVVVPAYNAGEYLVQCIENLVCQSYKKLEIIVVDDGSVDKTSEIVSEFPTVKYIYQENQGVSAARNTGIDAAKGDYIHFMDADDLVSLNFYEKMVSAAEETEADVACCGFIFERFPSLSAKYDYRFLVSRIDDKLLLTDVCNYGACWKYLLRLDFLKKINLRFEEGISAGEDRIFSLQAVYHAGKIVSVPDAVYFYKDRERSVTRSKDLAIIRKRHQDRKYAEQFQRDFAREHHFELDRTFNQQHFQYKLLGLPILSKKIYHVGKVKWFFLGIPVFQKKEAGK